MGQRVTCRGALHPHQIPQRGIPHRRTTGIVGLFPESNVTWNNDHMVLETLHVKLEWANVRLSRYLSWGSNQEQQPVCQEPKTSSTADEETDEEICNNKEQNKGSVRKLPINGLTVMHSVHKLDATGVSIKWAGYWDLITQSILRKFLTSLLINQNAYAHDCCL